MSTKHKITDPLCSLERRLTQAPDAICNQVAVLATKIEHNNWPQHIGHMCKGEMVKYQQRRFSPRHKSSLPFREAMAGCIEIIPVRCDSNGDEGCEVATHTIMKHLLFIRRQIDR